MPSRLTIGHARLADGTALVAVAGWLDVAAMPALLAAIESAAAPGEPLALDLCELQLTDARSLGVLLNTVRRLHTRHRMLVACPDGPLRSALEQTGVSRSIDLVADLGRPAELSWAADRQGGESAAALRSHASTRRPSTAPHRRALLTDATVAIEAHHADPQLGLEDVARRIATSARQLQRVFAEHADTSFRDELSAVRMQHAAALLITTDLPIGAIAARVGHRQAAQLAKAFRRHYGSTPSAFRSAARREAQTPTDEAADPPY